MDCELLKVNYGSLVDFYHKTIRTAKEIGNLPAPWCEATIVSPHNKDSKAVCDN